LLLVLVVRFVWRGRYEWRHDLSHWLDGWLLGGNYHASELSFVFGNEWPPILHSFTPDDRAMSDFVMSRWTDLAKTLRSPNPPANRTTTRSPAGSRAAARGAGGDPGGAEVFWPQWVEGEEAYLELKWPGVSQESRLRSDVCESLWDTLPK
jgi:hypothetical protein